MKTTAFIALAAASLFTTAADATQFVIVPDIIGGTGTPPSYKGPSVQGGNLGVVNDGGRDAFDGFGFYNATGGLAFSRQTEAFMDQNLFRFFDTFTNTSSERVVQTVTFYGNLGSDGRTRQVAGGSGYSVTCEYVTACAADPVVATIYGNNNLGVQTLNGEYLSIDFTLTLDPGQSASLLNFAFLASDTNGTNASDVALAIERAHQLVANPMLAGLTDEQLRRVANFDLGLPAAAVPEPASWALMIGGFAVVGSAMRRRQTIPAFS